MKTLKNNVLASAIIVICILINNNLSNAQCVSWDWADNSSSSPNTTKNDYGKDVATDDSNNVFVVGEFQEPSITFGSTTLTNIFSSTDIYIVKYDENGNVLWAKSAVGNGEDYVTGAATDSLGNVYITGYFQSAAITFGANVLTNTGGNDVFIVKYNGDNGNVLWAKSATGSGADYAMDIATDNSNNVYITGYFGDSGGNDNITFGSVILTKPCYNWDMFLVKYDSDGNVLWAQCADEGYWGGAKGISLTTDNSSNLYVTGTYRWEPITFGSTVLSYDIMNGEQMYIAKYNSSGTPIWAKKACGENTGAGIGHAPDNIITDNSGNVYITGYYDSDAISFGSLTLNTTTGPAADIFLVKYNSYKQGKKTEITSAKYETKIV